MSKKLFLAVLPLLALAMASCSRGNGGTSSQSGGSSGAAGDSSEESAESSEVSEESEESQDASGGDTPSTEGCDFKVGDVYYAMEQIDPDLQETSVAEKYTVGSVAVEEGDTISFYKDGEVIALFLDMESPTDKNNTNERPGSSTPAESYTIHNDATADVYLKFHSDGSISFWVTGYATSGEDAPTEGYALLINGDRYAATTPLSEKSPTGQDQSFATVTFEADDEFVIYNGETGISFHVSLDTASVAGTDTGTSIRMPAGTYDVYVKTQWENNQVYIGNHAA